MKKLLLFMVAIAGFVGLQSCSDKDDDKDINPGKVPQIYVEALKTIYPEAKGVEWEKKTGYTVAEFTQAAVQDETEVWFDGKANWAMTRHDYGENLFMIPADVNRGFETSAYALWNVDEICYYEFPGTSFYVINVEKSGLNDMNLFFDGSGVMIKEAPESAGDILPDFKI